MAHIELDDRDLIVACPACGQKNRLAYERLAEATRCGACKAEIRPPAVPIDIPSAEAFDALVAHAALPVVVDYWAAWCGPCRMVAPELQKVAERGAGRLLVVKVDTDALPDLGQRFRIMSIPTMAVFDGGREVGRTSGARPASDIEAFVHQSVAR